MSVKKGRYGKRLAHVSYKIKTEALKPSLGRVAVSALLGGALNQSSAADGGSFAPSVQIQKQEIHKVFLHF